MSARSAPALLADLVGHAARIEELCRGAGSFDEIVEDRTVRDAILWNLLVVGEVAGRFDNEFRESHPGVPWADIRGLRNIIAHGYDIIDWDILRPVLESGIPELLRSARGILERYGPPPTE